MDFYSVTLKKDILIDEICSVHYCEFAKHYTFPGEKHDFWELVYIDKGEILVNANSEEFLASSGDLLFHAPNEWHTLRANGVSAANVMILSFRCLSQAMQSFVNRRIKLSATEKNLLRNILSESQNAFSSPLDNPYDNSLQRAENTPIGSEQLIEVYLTQLLLLLLRQTEKPSSVDRKSGSAPMLDAIIAYMEQNVSKKLSLEILASEFHVSTSYIKRLFAQYKQTGAIHYFTLIKIDQAKQLLRESNLDISKIAEMLGYDNIYYFSNQFKKIRGMSPMEYRRSVNAIAERGLRQQ